MSRCEHDWSAEVDEAGALSWTCHTCGDRHVPKTDAPREWEADCCPICGVMLTPSVPQRRSVAPISRIGCTACAVLMDLLDGDMVPAVDLAAAERHARAHRPTGAFSLAVCMWEFRRSARRPIASARAESSGVDPIELIDRPADSGSRPSEHLIVQDGRIVHRIPLPRRGLMGPDWTIMDVASGLTATVGHHGWFELTLLSIMSFPGCLPELARSRAPIRGQDLTLADICGLLGLIAAGEELPAFVGRSLRKAAADCDWMAYCEEQDAMGHPDPSIFGMA